jgi:hypothetical protein
MRRILLSLAVVGLLGCEKKETPPPVDTTAMAAPPAPMINLASVAGRWNMQTMPMDRDTVLLNYVLTAMPDTAGWTITFPGRAAIPVRILQVAGDSIVSEAGPYQSALRRGVKVTTKTVNRMQGDVMTGMTEARYSSGPDTLLMLRSRGTRAP